MTRMGEGNENMDPICSVVIPAYNSAAYIADSIHSVLRQTVESLEVIVIDDCSSDRTREIVLELMRQDARIRYFRHENNRGVAAARSWGIYESKSPWIAFLDADDLWEQEKLQKQFQLQRQTGAELLYSGAVCIDERGDKTPLVIYVPSSISYQTLLKGNDIVCSSAIVKKDWILHFPMEHSDAHEDYVAWLQMLRAGIRAVGIDEPLVRYRLTPGSKSRNKIRSAIQTWHSYQYAGVPFAQCCVAFPSYAIHGLKRYRRIWP